MGMVKGRVGKMGMSLFWMVLRRKFDFIDYGVKILL